MATENPSWLTVEQRDAPLIVSFPHTGTDIPPEISTAAELVRTAALIDAIAPIELPSFEEHNEPR